MNDPHLETVQGTVQTLHTATAAAGQHTPAAERGLHSACSLLAGTLLVLCLHSACPLLVLCTISYFQLDCQAPEVHVLFHCHSACTELIFVTASGGMHTAAADDQHTHAAEKGLHPNKLQ